MPSKLKIHGALLIVGLVYGANYTVAKVIMPEFVGPFAIILIRVVSGALLFWLVDIVTGPERIKYKRDYIKLAGLSVLGVAINQLAFFKGLNTATPITASVLMTSSPIIVMVAAYFILKESISRIKLLGIALGATGAIMLIGVDGFEFSNKTFIGNLLIVINAISFSIYLVLIKPLLLRYKPITIIRWIFFFGSFIVIPFGYQEFIAVEWTLLPAKAWLSLTFIVLAVTFLAYLFNNWALQFVSPTTVGYYIYLQPVFATAIAVSFRGDQITLEQVVYTILIFSGVYLVSIHRGSTSKVR